MTAEKTKKQKAGHYEVHGETIAKFELFDQGFNPYSRYLDVDKVDLILRKRVDKDIRYVEIQVKYGRLYKCEPKWERAFFDYTSWRFFKPDEFADSHENLYVAYVLVHPPPIGYKDDIFIFPAIEFHRLINQAVATKTKKGMRAKMYIARSRDGNRWYVWRRMGFQELNSETVVDVTHYRRSFRFDFVTESSQTTTQRTPMLYPTEGSAASISSNSKRSNP